MNDSSICRERPGARARRFTAGAVAAIVSMSWLAVGMAIDPERVMSQYIRDQWGNDRGYQGGAVHAIAQTADGYLWIAAEKGLVRFDGLTFRLFQYSGPASNSGPTVLGLVPLPEGGLWARLRGPALVRYNKDTLESVAASLHLPDTVVTATLRTRDDAIVLATLGFGLMASRAGRLETLLTQEQMPGSFIISMAEASDGSIWLGTRDSGLFRMQGRRVTAISNSVPDQKINCLLPADNGEIWIGTDNGIARWDGAGITGKGVPASLAHVRALTMMRDRDGNIWIGTASQGLLRLNSQGLLSSDSRNPRSRDTVTALFEDRDSNVWVGSTRGIERIRDGVFTTYSTAQGLPSDAQGPVYADAAHRTWFAPSGGGLYYLRGGRIARINDDGLTNDVVYSIAGGPGQVWVGRQRGGLTHLAWQGDALTVRSFTQAQGLAQNSVYAVHRAKDGTVWAGTLSGGVSRLKEGVFTTFTVAHGLTSNTVSSILETTDGTMWFGTPTGLNAFSSERWRRYTSGDGMPSNEVNALFEDSNRTLWIGTSAGLAIVEGGRMRPLTHAPATLRLPILGIAEDKTGSLWMATPEHVLRVNRDRLALGTLADADLRSYGVADGLLGVEGVKRHRSVVSDVDGRVWFSMNAGISMVDPARASGRAQPALAHIERLWADGRAVDLGEPAKVSAGPQRITLTYAGLSLAVPERVSFRYRLDGFDSDWSAARSEHEAVYTNLGPGSYRFRVMASNSDGLWNGPEASLAFDIAPVFWQTAWFRLAAALICAGIVLVIYRVRVLQVASQLNVRFEERLAERTRIAQELHDTLLQGFVSASMQLHVAADRLPADSPAKASLVRVLDLMGRVIEEGRNAVRGLRSSSTASDDLEQAFSGVQQEVAPEQGGYRLIVEGRQRALNPIIRDEVYRIGREALVNALRHAKAKNVELELEYGTDQLRILVRDDGRGIDPDVIESGSDGHWGLSGMRERAERIGARLKVWSRESAGTEVELSVPAHIAFHEGHGGRRKS